MGCSALRVVVMGGSLGGLSAALFLREAGCEVSVFERSRTPLAGRGAGIALNPASVRYFTLRGTIAVEAISMATRRVRYVGEDGGSAAEIAVPYRFGSYDVLYRSLMDAFGPAGYHLGRTIVGFEEDAAGVTVRTADGGAERCDLLVCADGVRSTARTWLAPDAQPQYAGYVAWRGTLSEREIDPRTFDLLRDTIAYRLMPDSHMLIYPIPEVGASLGDVERCVNWLWYRNVPRGPAFDALMTDQDGNVRDVSLGPGTVRPQNVAALKRDAAVRLPQWLADAIGRTASPFIQAIMDCDVRRMATGRVALIGDGAFVARPHAAAGTAKAAEDAWQLGLALRAAGGDVSAALRDWEPRQLSLGRALVERNRQAGSRLQSGAWPVGAPLAFGLYAQGDSVMP